MLMALLVIFSAGAMAQNSFNYQAVIREGGKVVENKSVNLRLSVMLDNKVYYSEQHSATTNAYGNVSVSVGEGKPLIGKFEDIPWESMRVMMQVEVSADGTDNYTNMGSMQIQPVPYTIYAARTTTVIQPKEATEDPIFEVRDSEGNLMFAVYETGVKVFVDYNDNTKAAKSKFAVAGRSVSKGEENLLTIDAAGTTAYVDENAKAAKSKFAVAGRSAKKGEGDLLSIDGSGSTIYVGGEGKAAKSKFAVAGRSAKKTAENNYSLDGDGSTVYVDFADNDAKGGSDVLSIDGSQATFYVDDTDEGKAAKSKFAVAGRGANKDVQTAFVIDGMGTLVYIDDFEDDKAAKSKFAVTGSSANKGTDNFFTIDRDSTRIYINDTPVAADTTGTEPGSTPVITPSFASAFAIVGLSQKTELLTVNKDSTTIKVDTYVAEEVQSNSGEVEKIVDDSKASKVYATGKINLNVEKTENNEIIGSSYAYLTYAYYHSEDGEYLYLNNNWDNCNYELRNYWLVDGKIYHDTTFVFSPSWGVEPIFDNHTTSNREEDYTPIDWDGKDLLVILESEMKKAGYKVTSIDNVNHYYKVEDNEEREVMQSKRNVVTTMTDADIFNNNLATFKTLLNPIISLSYDGCNISEDVITNVEWKGVSADEYYNKGYMLFDDEITTENIINAEKEQHRIDTMPKTESEIYADDYFLLHKHSLDEIEYMFSALKKGFVVMVSPTEGGTVSGIDAGHGTYNYFDQITLTANANEGYIFTGWSDGNTENPRTIAVTKHLNLWANFANINELYELVDLGLATKWATTNLGAKSVQEFGNYYAWGEAHTKKTYSEESYTLNHASNFQDAATSMLGGNYRIPSQSDWRALMDSCTWKFDDYYNATVTGPNGNSIYLPANCGYYDSEGYHSTYNVAYYWSRTLSKEEDLSSAWTAWFGYDSETPDGYGKGFDNANCTVGYQIRPVANTFYVATGKNSNGGGKVTGGGVYRAGQSVTLTAVPDPYCSFVAWGDGVTDNPRTVTPTDNITMYANFTPPSTLFVSGRAGADDITGDGSEAKPLATIAAAIDTINSCNYLMEYTIMIDSVLTGTQEIAGENIVASKITLQGKNGLNNNIPQDTLNGNNSGTVLTINTTVPVEIGDLLITGGNNSGNGGGLYINNGNVTLNRGALIGASATETANSSSNGNKAKSGAGVYLNGGTLTLKNGSAISYNYATAYAIGTSNEGGGGVLVTGDGQLNIETGAKIDYNGSEMRAGGVLLAGKANVSMTGGEISNNTAAYFGGGVLFGSKDKEELTFEMSGGTISNNTVTSSDEGNAPGGGGVFLDQGTFTMSGNASIKDNTATLNGGGIRMVQNAVFNMQGGTVSGNSLSLATQNFGVGVSLALNAQLNMSGAANISADNDVYGSINIVGSLEADAPVATITPWSYNSGTIILTAADTVTLSEWVDKFVIKQIDSDLQSTLENNGQLYSRGAMINFETAPNSSEYPKLYVFTEDDLIKLATWVNGNENVNLMIMTSQEINQLPLCGITFIMLNNIELTNAFNMPIGTGESYGGKPFAGTFDGNGHTISKLNTNQYNITTNPALFGFVSGEVKNLTVSGNSTCSGIVVNLYGTVENCESKVTINGSSCAGGIAATLQTGTIRNCINSGTITGGSHVGGIAGESPNQSIIDGCINKGEVIGDSYVGGIIGQSFRIVRNSVNIGKVTGNNNYVGGIVGLEHYSNSSSAGYGIENCYNLGEVTGNGYVGGITGCEDIYSTLNYNASVKNCYNGGLVSSTSSSKGGVIGYISTGQGTGKVYIENSYYFTDKGVTVGIGGTIPNDYIVGSQPTSVSESDLDTLLESLNNWVGTKTSYKKWKAGTNGYPEFE